MSPAGGGAKTQGRILIASLTLGSLATAGAVWWYYTQQLAAMEESAVQELTVVSDTKTRQIANWRSERLGDGRVQMASPTVAIAARILAGKGTEADQANLVDVMTRLQRAFLYTGGALCDLDGTVRLGSGKAPTDSGRLRGLAAQAVQSKDALLADLSPDAATGRPMMAMVFPIGQLGAVVMDIDPSRFLYPYLGQWPGRSRTAESLLIRRDGDDALYLSELRNVANAPLRFRRTTKGLGLPPDAAFETPRLFHGADYRGAPVLAIIRHIPDSPWFLSAKINASEVDGPERRLGWEMAAITALIALVNIAGASLVWRGQSARIHKEREEWFQAVANDTPAYLWMASTVEGGSFFNAPMAKFLGTSSYPDTWQKFIHPEDVERVSASFAECLRTHGEYSQEFRIRRHDGEYRTVLAKGVPRFSSLGMFRGYAGSMEDVTGRRLAEKGLREANERLAAELAESTRKELEIHGLSARLIDAQEEERKRLARELHDDLSQQIAALSLATANLKRQIPEDRVEARAQSGRMHEKLVQLAEAVRHMSHELHPAILQYSGLAAALRSYCEEFGTLTGITVRLEIEGAYEGVAPATALCLFRVTQEALRNVAKHAGVAEARVELQRTGGMLRLSVSDAGVGMERERSGAAAGLGLLNIRERARLVRGSVTIESSPGKGTRLTVAVPESA